MAVQTRDVQDVLRPSGEDHRDLPEENEGEADEEGEDEHEDEEVEDNEEDENKKLDGDVIMCNPIGFDGINSDDSISVSSVIYDN